MAAPIKPNKKVALGRTTWWIVPAIADITAPTALEINAAGALNITCFLMGDQEGIMGDTAKVELARLLCEQSTSESLDVTKFSMPNFRFAFDPQAAAAANDKKAWALLKDGYSGYAVRRQNVISITDALVVAGQFVDTAPVIGAIGIPKQSSADSAGIYVFDVAFGITATPAFNKVVA